MGEQAEGERFSTSFFEQSLRRLIEAGSFDAAEKFVRESAAGENDLLEAFAASRDAMSIEDWASIAADMEDAQRYLAPEDRGREWEAVFAGLVNNSGHDAVFVEISFGLDPEPYSYEPDTKPNYMTDEQWAEHKGDVAGRVFLPRGRRIRNSYEQPGLAIRGLEELVRIERERNPEIGNRPAWDRHSKRITVAAGAILLRFHQLLEHYAVDPGLPRPLPLFVHVARVEWPMEVGIYEYGTDATRLLYASSDSFDHGQTAEILASRQRQRELDYLNDTRRMVVELRELQEAVDLWPRWVHPLARATFACYVRDGEELTRKSLRAMYGVDTWDADGERLYELIAKARHPNSPEAAFEPIAPHDRRDLQKIAINFAKRFGGGSVRERFRDYPQVPPELLDAFPKLKRPV